MQTKKKDIISFMGLVILSVVGLFLCNGIDKPFREYDPGAAFLPRLILWIIFGLSVIKIVLMVLENLDGEDRILGKQEIIKGLITIALVGCYYFFYKSLGFIVDTLLYLALQISVVTPKEKYSWKKTLSISLVTTLIVYVIFAVGFSMRFAKGILKFM